MTFFVVAC